MKSGKIAVFGLAALGAAFAAGIALWPRSGKEPVDVVERAERDAAAKKPVFGSKLPSDPQADVRERLSTLPGEDKVRAWQKEAGDLPKVAPTVADAQALAALSTMVDRGQSLTVDAMSQPKMSEMVPSDPKYNPAVEARQRFHFFEEELRKAQPLNPESWRRIQKAHVDDYKGVLQRSKELSDEGRTLEARALIEEWSELQSKYQAQAYGRVPPPVSAEATPR